MSSAAVLTIAGAPVRSAISPPSDGLIPNYYRKSNPFTADAEQDWISPSTRLVANGVRSVKQTDQDRPPVPPRAGGLVSPSGTIDARNHVPIAREKDLARIATTSSVAKSPPPVPSKPIALSSRAHPSPPPTKITRAASVPNSRSRVLASDRGSQSSFASTRSQLTPSPRNPSAGTQSAEHVNAPRTNVASSAGRIPGTYGGARALLDDDASDNLDWKPLLPKS